MLKSIKTFNGGYSFRNYDGQSLPILVENPIPPKVVIPLRQGLGTEVKPLLKVGDAVFSGQIIARDDDRISSPIHASVVLIYNELKEEHKFDSIRKIQLPKDYSKVNKPKLKQLA